MVRAVFDAVPLLLRPPSTTEATAADVDAAQPDGALARLWADHLRALFPDGFRGVDFDGVDLVLLDADVTGLMPDDRGCGSRATSVTHAGDGPVRRRSVRPRPRPHAVGGNDHGRRASRTSEGFLARTASA